MTWAVFLDRDGVLTEAPVVDGRHVAPLTVGAMHPLPGARQAVERLHAPLGALVLVVTNQPDVARGRLPESELDAMHRRLVDELGVDGVRACPHDNADDCLCRKPRPGLLLDLAAGHGIDLATSWTVGDRWVDVAAGRAAGTATILVEHAGSWRTTSAGAPADGLSADAVVGDVVAAAGHVARAMGFTGATSEAGTVAGRREPA